MAGATGATGATGPAGPGGAVTAVAVNAIGTVSVTDTSGTQTSAASVWRVGANATTATQNFGTTSNQSIDLMTNNAVRGRIGNGGNFVFGGTAGPFAGDQVVAIANSVSPFALTGYTAFNGAGVYGQVQTASTTSFSAVQGVYSGTGNGAGVLGNYAGTNTSNVRAGVRGTIASVTAAAGGAGVYGSHQATSGNQHMGVLGDYNSAAFGIGVYGLGFGGGLLTGDNDVGVVGWRANNANYSGYFNGNHVIANGTKSASVGTSKGNQLLYATESPEVWFEDIGGAQLVGGKATVLLDAMFLETVVIDRGHPLRVFIQMEGESQEVFVTPGTTSFDVKERNGGQSNAPFSYRVMAKRVNFQDHRFGNDPVWGPGDTRRYSQYAAPPPVGYEENVQFQAQQRQQWVQGPMPEGFVTQAALQRQAEAASERE